MRTELYRHSIRQAGRPCAGFTAQHLRHGRADASGKQVPYDCSARRECHHDEALVVQQMRCVQMRSASGVKGARRQCGQGGMAQQRNSSETAGRRALRRRRRRRRRHCLRGGCRRSGSSFVALVVRRRALTRATRPAEHAGRLRAAGTAVSTRFLAQRNAYCVSYHDCCDSDSRGHGAAACAFRSRQRIRQRACARSEEHVREGVGQRARNSADCEIATGHARNRREA